LLTDTLVGHRAGSSYSFTENIILYFNTIFRWFLPIQINNLQLFLFLLFAAAGIFSLLLIMKNRGKDESVSEKIYPVLLFILLYSAIIIISSTTTAYDKIDNRLLSPLFIPVIIIMCFIIDIIYEWYSKHFKQKIITFLFFAFIIIWMQTPIEKTIYELKYYMKQSGREYESNSWKNNSIINYLNSNKHLGESYSFYSNVPEAVYLLTDIETKWSPQKTLYNSPEIINVKAEMKGKWNIKGKSCIVWFSNIDRKFLFSIDELKEIIHMVKIAQFTDGEIYIIEKSRN